MNTSFPDFIAHAFAQFGPTDSAAQRWDTANTLARSLGGTALNIGALQLDRDKPSWMLSSMSAAWLAQYVEEGLYKIDPFIPQIKARNTPIELDTRQRKADQPLNTHLLKAGYRFLYGLPFQGADRSERRVVTFCTDLTRDELVAQGALERIRFLAAILVIQVQPPDSTAPLPDQYFIRTPLSKREAEALALLAHGLRNDRIGERLGIAEVTVRKHINAARQKLGALTREQAVAIALKNKLITLGSGFDI